MMLSLSPWHLWSLILWLKSRLTKDSRSFDDRERWLRKLFSGASMQPKPLTLKILDIVSIFVLVIAAYMALTAPTERVMGEVQKVFYFHIGTAWTAMLG